MTTAGAPLTDQEAINVLVGPLAFDIRFGMGYCIIKAVIFVTFFIHDDCICVRAVIDLPHCSGAPICAVIVGVR